MAHQGELRQIILNLVKNSIEAMPAGGNIHILLKSTGESIDISVTDTGPGIDPDKRKSIFLPFFTTKDDKETNRGLGLYMAYKLVKKNKGVIRLDQNYTNGCRIVIGFPAQAPINTGHKL